MYMSMYQNFVDQNFTSNEQNINFENTKSSQNAWTDAASPPTAQCPRVQAGSSAGGHHLSLRRSAQPAQPAAANLCSFQSAISKREDLCRTENQYLIFRITLAPSVGGWPQSPLPDSPGRPGPGDTKNRPQPRLPGI